MKNRRVSNKIGVASVRKAQKPNSRMDPQFSKQMKKSPSITKYERIEKQLENLFESPPDRIGKHIDSDKKMKTKLSLSRIEKPKSTKPESTRTKVPSENNRENRVPQQKKRQYQFFDMFASDSSDSLASSSTEESPSITKKSKTDQQNKHKLNTSSGILDKSRHNVCEKAAPLDSHSHTKTSAQKVDTKRRIETKHTPNKIPKLSSPKICFAANKVLTPLYEGSIGKLNVTKVAKEKASISVAVACCDEVAKTEYKCTVEKPPVSVCRDKPVKMEKNVIIDLTGDEELAKCNTDTKFFLKTEFHIDIKNETDKESTPKLFHSDLNSSQVTPYNSDVTFSSAPASEIIDSNVSSVCATGNSQVIFSNSSPRDITQNCISKNVTNHNNTVTLSSAVSSSSNISEISPTVVHSSAQNITTSPIATNMSNTTLSLLLNTSPSSVRPPLNTATAPISSTFTTNTPASSIQNTASSSFPPPMRPLDSIGVTTELRNFQQVSMNYQHMTHNPVPMSNSDFGKTIYPVIKLHGVFKNLSMEYFASLTSISSPAFHPNVFAVFSNYYEQVVSLKKGRFLNILLNVDVKQFDINAILKSIYEMFQKDNINVSYLQISFFLHDMLLPEECVTASAVKFCRAVTYVFEMLKEKTRQAHAAAQAVFTQQQLALLERQIQQYNILNERQNQMMANLLKSTLTTSARQKHTKKTNCGGVPKSNVILRTTLNTGEGPASKKQASGSAVSARETYPNSTWTRDPSRILGVPQLGLTTGQTSNRAAIHTPSSADASRPNYTSSTTTVTTAVLSPTITSSQISTIFSTLSSQPHSVNSRCNHVQSKPLCLVQNSDNISTSCASTTSSASLGSLQTNNILPLDLAISTSKADHVATNRSCKKISDVPVGPDTASGQLPFRITSVASVVDPQADACNNSAAKKSAAVSSNNNITSDFELAPDVSSTHSLALAPDESAIDSKSQIRFTDDPTTVIDLTWLDDIEPEEIAKEMEPFPLKSELDQHLQDEASPRETVSTDSGLGSPIDFQAVDALTCICGKVATHLCSCNRAMYCGTDCQLEDWPYHQNSCERNRRASEESSQAL